jgi:flagellar basal body-associated protein FliL
VLLALYDVTEAARNEETKTNHVVRDGNTRVCITLMMILTSRQAEQINTNSGEETQEREREEPTHGMK